MDILGNAVGIIAIVCFLYMIMRSTGFEAKLRRMKAQSLDQLRSGWGVDECVRLTEIQIKSKLRLGHKENKSVICGVNYFGKLTKWVNTDNNHILCEVKKGFKENFGLASPLYLLLSTSKKDNDISSVSEKVLYLKEGVLENLHGIYYLQSNTKKDALMKFDTIRLMLEKMNYEDVTGRISNLATKVVYLDIVHAEQSDILKKKGDILTADMSRKNVSTVDMLAA